MRNLTIKRAKRFVACLGTLKVYIEDPAANDLTINGCACRKLGSLKNGEEKTFEISEAAAKVFVIADKLSKGFCNEFYPLPQGSEDIVLTGKNCFNPVVGNPFRFDGVTDVQVLENRKKGSRKALVVLLVACAIGFVFGWMIGSRLANADAEPKDFSVKGMTITLTDAFKESEVQGYDAGFESKKVALLVLQEKFSLAPGFGDHSLEEYGALVLESNQKKAQLKTENGLTYYEYTYNAPNGNTYHYFVMLYKGPDAFYIVQFFTLEKDAASCRDDIFQWAATVTFE